MDPARPATMESSWTARLLGPVEEQPWLEKAAESLQQVIDPLFAMAGGDRLKDFLHGRWLGHSLHAALTDVPIGLWTGSLLLDMVGAAKSATVVNAFGCGSAVGAVVTGITDWTATHGRERRLGLLHGMLNAAGLGFQLASIGARMRRRRWRGFGLSLAGYAVSSGAAFLGGELVYGRGLMVNHNAWTAGPENWTPLGREADVPVEQARAFELDGRKVLVYRGASGVSAMENTCTHAGGPLDEGEMAHGVVTCPWHGSQFRLADGSVCRGPATYPQLRLEARIRAGRIEVRGRQG